MQAHNTRPSAGEKRLVSGAAVVTVGVCLLPYREARPDIGLSDALGCACWALVVTGLMLWARGMFLRSHEIAQEM